MGCSSGGCGGCGASKENGGGCGGGMQTPQSLQVATNALSHVKHVIGVVSGKGGVGKSLVTSLLAITMVRKGFKVGILDADITGPSIPKVFGITDRVSGREDHPNLMVPPVSKGGISIMSINLLLENQADPVLWRGPILGNVVTQLYADTIWGDLDYLFVDMPPGTGDVPITVYQSLPVEGIVIVTSPQELVSMIVEKAVRMADTMQIPILGVVENFSYFRCPDNGKDYKIFGESHIEEILKTYELLLMGRLPINPSIAELCDKGELESLEETLLESVVLPE